MSGLLSLDHAKSLNKLMRVSAGQKRNEYHFASFVNSWDQAFSTNEIQVACKLFPKPNEIDFFVYLSENISNSKPPPKS